MFDLRVRPDAVEDIKSASRWYRDHREELADRFQKCVAETMTRVGSSPELYPQVHSGIRLAPVRRFPYGVFCDLIVVHAVLHDRRDPKLSKWRAGE